MPKTIITKPKTITVTLTVRTFRDAIDGAIRHGSLTDYVLGIRRQSRKYGVWLSSPDIIHVACGGAILRFIVVGRGEKYQPVGIAFAGANRAAGSRAVTLNTGDSPVKGSPFMELQVLNRALKLEDIVPHPPKGTAPIAKVYKFTLVIQRLRDGAIGLIDPYLENEN